MPTKSPSIAVWRVRVTSAGGAPQLLLHAPHAELRRTILVNSPWDGKNKAPELFVYSFSPLEARAAVCSRGTRCNIISFSLGIVRSSFAKACSMQVSRATYVYAVVFARALLSFLQSLWRGQCSGFERTQRGVAEKGRRPWTGDVFGIEQSEFRSEANVLSFVHGIAYNGLRVYTCHFLLPSAARVDVAFLVTR